MQVFYNDVHLLVQSILYSLLLSLSLWSTYRILLHTTFSIKLYHPLVWMLSSYMSIGYIFYTWVKDVWSIFSTHSLNTPFLVDYFLQLNGASPWFTAGATPTLNIFAFLIVLYGLSASVYKVYIFVKEIKNTNALYQMSTQTQVHHLSEHFQKIYDGVLSTFAVGRRSPSIVFIEEKIGPLTISLLKPIIVYPIAALNQLTPEEVSTILAHEITHIRFHDFYINFLIKIINTLMAFNPILDTWFKDIQLHQEMNCDKKVLNYYARSTYLEALMKIADFQFMQFAQNAQSDLLRRVKWMYGENSLSIKLLFQFKTYQPFILQLGLVLIVFIFSRSSAQWKEEDVTHHFATNIHPEKTMAPSPLLARPFASIKIKERAEVHKNHLAMRRIEPIRIPKLALNMLPVLPSHVSNDIHVHCINAATVIQYEVFKLVNVGNCSLTSKEAERLKNFTIAGLIWIVSHKYFSPDLVKINSFTPEELSSLLDSYGSQANLASEDIANKVSLIKTAEELNNAATEVRNTMLQLMYWENVQ